MSCFWLLACYSFLPVDPAQAVGDESPDRLTPKNELSL